jgi:hypothetical protein
MAKRTLSADQLLPQLPGELWQLILDQVDLAESAQVLRLLCTAKQLAWMLAPRLRGWLLGVATYYYLPAPMIKTTGSPLHEARLSLQHFVCEGVGGAAAKNSMAHLNRLKKTWYRMVAEQQPKTDAATALWRFSECLYLLHLAQLTKRLLYRHDRKRLFVAPNDKLESREAQAFLRFASAQRVTVLAHFDQVTVLYREK